MSILHISDIHLGPPFNPRAAEALVRIAPTLDPGVLVASGDFTQRAKEQQFIDAKQLLERLPKIPRVVVPGNHDVPLYRLWERLTAPNHFYKKHIGEQLETSLTVDGAVFVGLNTTAPWMTVTRGLITRRQLDFAESVFAGAANGAARIVVAHHQFVPAPDLLDDNGTLGGRRALERFAELGVDMVLGGHLHRAFVGRSRDFMDGVPEGHSTLLIHSGTSTSGRGRGREKGKNSFNHLRVYADRVEITPYMYSRQRDAFEPFSAHMYPRAGQRLKMQEEVVV